MSGAEVYAIADVKHGRIVWDVLVGCILRTSSQSPRQCCT